MLGRAEHLWRRALVGPVVAGVIVGASAPAVATSVGDRGMWVWEGPDPAALTFASERGVDDLYVNAPPGFSGDPAYAALVADAHARGIRVHALAGDPTWADENADHMVAWVREVRASGLFDGAQVDVEPYLLPAWSSDRTGLMKRYVRALSRARKAAGKVDLVAVVPFWFDEPSLEDRKGRTLLSHVVSASDGIAVMAYRDGTTGPDGIIQLAAGEVAAAGAAGKTAVIGVQTAPDALDKLTFFEEGDAAMEAALAEVDAAFAGAEGYGGTAVHHYSSWAQLAP